MLLGQCLIEQNHFRDPCKTGIYGTFEALGLRSKIYPNYLLCLRFSVLLRLDVYPYLPVLQGSLSGCLKTCFDS